MEIFFYFLIWKYVNNSLITRDTNLKKISFCFQGVRTPMPTSRYLSQGTTASRIFSSTPLRENKNLLNTTPDSVVGLNRKKLAAEVDESSGTHWLDNQRESLQGYEYLCRVGEAKRWIEKCIGEELPSEAELCEDGLRDGVILAKLSRAFVPDLVRKIVPPAKKLQFRHTENINNFFKFLDVIQIPELFRFELTDLYDKKNIPKVIFCIHALSYLLAQDEKAPKMSELVGKLEFTEAEINASQKALNGASLPNFNKAKDENLESSRSVKETPRSKPSSASQHMNSLELPRPAPPPHAPARRTKKSTHRPSPSQEPDLDLDLVITSIIRFQALTRASLIRYHVFVRKMMLSKCASEITYLQSVIRAQKFRNGPFAHEFAVYASSTPILAFQAMARGVLTRRILRHTVRKVRKQNGHLALVQAAMRGALFRARLLDQLEALEDAAPSVTLVQSAGRGVLIRRSLRSHTGALERNTGSLIVFSAVCRGALARKALVIRLKTLDLASVSISQIQASIRGSELRRRVMVDKTNLGICAFAITMLQARARTILAKKQTDQLNMKLFRATEEIVTIQSIARGGLSRVSLSSVLDRLDISEAKMNTFFAIIRGEECRKRISGLNYALKKFGSPSVTKVQALTRGLLTRFELDLLLEELEKHHESICEVQGYIRGWLVRKHNRERDEYYLRNLDRVIKVQAYIRGRDLGAAYRKLVTMTSPPILVIARFAHVLNDTDQDFADEVYLSQLQTKIAQKTKDVAKLETTTAELDAKVALLVRNKISLDELLKQRSNGYAGYKVVLEPDLLYADKTTWDKTTRRRVECFLRIFYLLQTEPKYLAELAQCAPKDTQQVSLRVFSYDRGSTRRLARGIREEYMLARSLAAFIQKGTECFPDAESFAESYIENGNTPWQKLFTAHMKLSSKSDILHNIFGGLVSAVADIPGLLLESDPLKIHAMEFSSEKTKNILAEDAIQIPAVRAAFVRNLAQLRELANLFLETAWAKMEEIPLFVKTLSAALYNAVRLQYDIPEHMALSMAGFILFDLCIGNVLSTPENYGIALTTSGAEDTLRLKSNLKQIAKVLSQMALMAPFAQEDIYMQPLNEYIELQAPLVGRVLEKLVLRAHSNFDLMYGMLVIDDLGRRRKPQIDVDSTDLATAQKLLVKHRHVFPENDVLISILDELEGLEKQAKQGLSKVFGSGVFPLDLIPLASSEAPSSKKNALLIQAKRCIIYMLQVQSGRDLLDLLLLRIRPEHEAAFAAIIAEEKREKREKSMYTNAAQGSLGDLTKSSYHDLKCIALERILELEQMGLVLREDGFQQLVAQIATDIRAKKELRSGKRDEIRHAERVLHGVEAKEAHLKKILEVYNEYIGKATALLQSVPGKKKKYSFFSKQYFYQRALRRQGKSPKFGSYKYSAKYLSEQGILSELRGIKCGVLGIELPKVDFMFSCDEVGVFMIEAASGLVPIPNAIAKLSLDDLLLSQYEGREEISVFEGVVKFETETFLSFIFKKFYDNS